MATCQKNKMKLYQLIESVEALNALVAEKLPAKVSFVLMRFLKKVAPEVEEYHKTRNEKLKIFGTPVLDEEGKETDKFTFDSGNGEKYIEEMKALEDTEISEPMPEVKLKDIEDIKIKPEYIAKLDWLIKE